MSLMIFLDKLPISFRPLSKYEKSFEVGVPWGIAQCVSNDPSKHHLTTRNYGTNHLDKIKLVRCSQNQIAANRRVCRVGKLPISFRPKCLSKARYQNFKSFRSASDLFTLAQQQLNSIQHASESGGISMSSKVYTVTVLKWIEHNPKHKKGFKSFMFNNGFLTDPKIAQLKPIECILFIYMLCVASESSCNQFQISIKSLPKHMRIGNKLMSNCLSQLQSLQLVTFEEKPSLRIELKELKRTKLNLNSGELETAPPAATSDAPVSSSKKESIRDKNRVVREAYRDAYKLRYNVDVVPSAKFHTAISHIVQRVGAEDAEKVVRYYLTHKDTLYVKSAHSIGLCLRDCESLRTQMLNGVQLTAARMKQFEKSQHHREQLERVDGGEL